MAVITNPGEHLFKHKASKIKYNKTSSGLKSSDVQGAIDEISPRAGVFTDSDLSVGKLTINHNLGLSAPYILIVTIFDNNGNYIIPDGMVGSTNSFEVDLSSYIPLLGTWGYRYV